MLAMLLLEAAASTQAGAEILYVVRRGWHTDVGFEAEELKDPLARLTHEFPGVHALFFSFGDRRYLLGRRRTANLFAALWPGPGLILATALTTDPAAAFGQNHVIRLQISTQQSVAAQNFIWAALRAEPAIEGPYAGSLFFEALPQYSAIHTCNTWVAEDLRAADLPVETRIVFAGQLWDQAKQLSDRKDLSHPDKRD